MRYKVELNINGNIMMATWCFKNCNGEWFGTDNLRTWFFDLEEEAVAFKLMWL